MRNKTFIYIVPTVIFFIFMTIMFVLNTSISMIGYVLLGTTLIISLILVLSHSLSETSFLAIVFGLIVLLSYISVQSWVLTLSIAVVSLIIILTQFSSPNHKWRIITIIGMIALLGTIILIDKNQASPVIIKEQIQGAVDHLENNKDILKVVIGVEEDTISCSMKVKSDLSDSKKKELGENCAKVLAKEVSKNSTLKKPTANYLGELYDYYLLELMIGTNHEEDEIIFMRKNKDSKELVW
ncbi:hypothetical protein GLV94_12455 [Virgibacillus halodenitrificans]|uniref:hypothetical protein n=1 Tax=Virgibacillus halodenitrificans TaxID=1482 RepID=UPI00136BD738|nr:hypothetical protein [Virgibacillus halodenitrificans]MYL46454.1 hypothetical protein [Virgibacillus halodenitrificans]MYL57880.1 hypothetical protein [Virgibacillus halodenitrificans]